MINFFKRIWSWMKKNYRSDVRNFFHFFLAFTGIFLILTAIIISNLRMEMYRTTDRNIDSLRNKQREELVDLAFQSSYQSNLDPYTYIILYDENKEVLYQDSDNVTKIFARSEFDETLIDHINFRRIYDGDNDDFYHFRTTVFPADLEMRSGAHVSYIQVLILVDQIRSSIDSISRTIIQTVVIFWLLSLVVAIHFSHWLLKPLQSALERQGAFVNNASHELRTPLSILQNRLQLLFQNPNHTIIEESENISASLNEVRNMRLLTSNLLDIAKQDEGLNIKTEEVGQDFFVEVFKNYKLLAENADREFQTSINTNKVMKIDPDLTKQLLTIFFDNAIKYTKEAGKIKMSVNRLGQYLEFIIADDGIGIPNSDKKKIFDHLYRVDEVRTRGVGGLGLGLSLAKQIVDKMKGKIVVSDNKPSGTIFTIRIKA